MLFCLTEVLPILYSFFYKNSYKKFDFKLILIYGNNNLK